MQGLMIGSEVRLFVKVELPGQIGVIQVEAPCVK